MLSGSDDRLGGGLSCPEKDRCTKYSCAGGFLRVLKEWISCLGRQSFYTAV
jgi:hypothetical protein